MRRVLYKNLSAETAEDIIHLFLWLFIMIYRFNAVKIFTVLKRIRNLCTRDPPLNRLVIYRPVKTEILFLRTLFTFFIVYNIRTRKVVSLFSLDFIGVTLVASVFCLFIYFISIFLAILAIRVTL